MWYAIFPKQQKNQCLPALCLRHYILNVCGCVIGWKGAYKQHIIGLFVNLSPENTNRFNGVFLQPLIFGPSVVHWGGGSAQGIDETFF